MDKAEELANLIHDEIRKDFNTVHLSGNLMNTIKVEKTETGWKVVIPAEMYDIGYWMYKRVVVYTHEGSYAQAVDEDGGISGVHVDYIERAISNAIEQWKKNVTGTIKITKTEA